MERPSSTAIQTLQRFQFDPLCEGSLLIRSSDPQNDDPVAEPDEFVVRPMRRR